MPDVEISAEIDRYDMEAARFDALAQIGMTRVSLDLRYGQPHQTRASVEETMWQAMTLQPDRIALRLG
jgi:oxygen-independent coproporphyrinogen-3 oxidase